MFFIALSQSVSDKCFSQRFIWSLLRDGVVIAHKKIGISLTFLEDWFLKCVHRTFYFLQYFYIIIFFLVKYELTNLFLITKFLFKIKKESYGLFTARIPIGFWSNLNTFCDMILHRFNFFCVYIIWLKAIFHVKVTMQSF